MKYILALLFLVPSIVWGQVSIWTRPPTFLAQGSITSPADGSILLLDNAGTSFNLLQFGGTTSSYPALKRSGANLQVRLADDSNYGTIITQGLAANRYAATIGNLPTMGACGTSPLVAGKDSAMFVTVGTGGVATSCAVTFAVAWGNPPVCIAQNDTDRVAYSIVTTTTAVTVTAAAAFTASSNFHILCIGR